jgi:hypothetical protein
MTQMDLLYLVLTVVLFLASVGLVVLFDRMS